MEKGDFRRERLAELGIDRLQRPPEHAWSARRRRMQDRWHRFMAGGWERTFFIGACGLALVVALVSLVALASRGGDGDGSASAVAGRKTSTPSASAKATPTAISIGVPDIPTNLPTQTPPPEPTEEDTEDRTDCDEIRGTPYRSNEERQWFEKNCGAQVNNPPPGQPTTRAPAAAVPPINPPPPTVPPPPQGMTVGEAIILGIAWMENSAGKSYDVDSGSCSGVHIGDHWVVSCSARLSGCTTAACATELQACVFADRRVVAASSC